jgi:hypothetical protein
VQTPCSDIASRTSNFLRGKVRSVVDSLRSAQTAQDPTPISHDVVPLRRCKPPPSCHRKFALKLHVLSITCGYMYDTAGFLSQSNLHNPPNPKRQLATLLPEGQSASAVWRCGCRHWSHRPSATRAGSRDYYCLWYAAGNPLQCLPEPTRPGGCWSAVYLWLSANNNTVTGAKQECRSTKLRPTLTASPSTHVTTQPAKVYCTCRRRAGGRRPRAYAAADPSARTGGQ